MFNFSTSFSFHFDLSFKIITCLEDRYVHTVQPIDTIRKIINGSGTYHFYIITFCHRFRRSDNTKETCSVCEFALYIIRCSYLKFNSNSFFDVLVRSASTSRDNYNCVTAVDRNRKYFLTGHENIFSRVVAAKSVAGLTRYLSRHLDRYPRFRYECVRFGGRTCRKYIP